MSKIPTAKEFFESKVFCNTKEEIHIIMIEFTKTHVKAALKEALESIPCLGSSTDIATYEEVENAVLKSYPLKNIK